MVSTLQPPRRQKKDKKKSSKRDSSSKQRHSSLSPSSSSSSSSRKRDKKRKEQPVAAKFQVSSLYTEDIGMVGVKRAKVESSTRTSSGPILKGPEGQKFKISETSEERLRRLRRKNRFDEGGGGPQRKSSPKATSLSIFAKKQQSSTVVPAATAAKKEPDFLMRALSSGRKKDTNNNNNNSQPQQQQSKKKGANNSQNQWVGTNQDLEKDYLRLTTYVKPENVRPMEVLIQSLAHIKSKYYQEEDFEWANLQLKSVRQDLTVQRLRNRFVLDVYETHGRILLEHGDLSEFNQCQTMIRCLTTSGVEPEDASAGGLVDSSSSMIPVGYTADDEPLIQPEESSDEFRAYYVLYSLVQNSGEDLTNALIRVRDSVREKTAEDASTNSSTSSSCKTSSSRHSLEVVKSVTHSDYRAFFKLYESAPHMSAYLMDFLVKRMREQAYERITAAYRPTICVEYFRGTLCFHDIEETRLFLRQMGAVFVKGKPPSWVDCKASMESKAVNSK